MLWLFYVGVDMAAVPEWHHCNVVILLCDYVFVDGEFWLEML